MKLKICLLGLLCLFFRPSAQPVSKDQALKIGDKVPDLAISNIINYKYKYVKLSDFKDKILILDFWATWCSPCVAMIPVMDSLQKEFSGKVQFLPVAYQSAAEVSGFMAKLQAQRGAQYTLPDVCADTQLAALFPHTYLPHYVWIDGRGVVIAITGYEEVDSGNIRKLLAGGSLSVVEKTDPPVIPYNNHLPLLVDGNGGRGQNLVYHSVLTSYTPGLDAGVTQYQPDSIRGRKITLRNVPLVTLFRNAYGARKVYFGNNRILLDVRDPSRFNSNLSGAPYLDWMAAGNGYCYELVVPPAMDSRTYAIMQEDMGRIFSQYRAQIVRMNRDCLVLERTGTEDHLRSHGGKSAAKFDGTGCMLQNWPLSYLVTQLNVIYMQKSPYPVINETGYSAYVDMELKANLSDTALVNKALAPYGLQLTLAKRDIDMLRITDADSRP
jgi:thiol-disulfide isomerase/thioredoxin